MTNLEVLATGTGRCGTLYMANLLTNMGIPCGHESIFTPIFKEAIERLNDANKIEFSKCSQREVGIWTNPKEIVADSSYMSAPFLNTDLLENTKIIHLVRNPLDVISSFALVLGYFKKDPSEHNDPYENFIKASCPKVYDNDFNNINRAAIYYVEWNKIIEKKANKNNYFFQKIEKPIDDLLKFLNKSSYKEISKKINHWNYNNLKITFSDLNDSVRKDVFEIASRYGYIKKIY